MQYMQQKVKVRRDLSSSLPPLLRKDRHKIILAKDKEPALLLQSTTIASCDTAFVPLVFCQIII
jgi:hypothetical protein